MSLSEFRAAMEAAAKCVLSAQLVHGDQYGQWQGVSEHADELAQRIRSLTPEQAGITVTEGVVVRPTQAMMEAGAKALADYICRKVPGNDNTAACAVYAAMLRQLAKQTTNESSS